MVSRGSGQQGDFRSKSSNPGFTFPACQYLISLLTVTIHLVSNTSPDGIEYVKTRA
jgi:hypothetical protein